MASGNRLRPVTDDQQTAVRQTVLKSKTYQALLDELNSSGYTPQEASMTVHTTGNEFIASLALRGGSDNTTATLTVEVLGDAVVSGTATIDVAGRHSQSGPTTYLKVTEAFDVYEYTVGEAIEE